LAKSADNKEQTSFGIEKIDKISKLLEILVQYLLAKEHLTYRHFDNSVINKTSGVIFTTLNFIRNV
jgi:hypothetical protein